MEDSLESEYKAQSEAELIKQGVDKLEAILRENRVAVIPDYTTIKDWCARNYGVGKDTAYRYIWDFCERILGVGL